MDKIKERIFQNKLDNVLKDQIKTLKHSFVTRFCRFNGTKLETGIKSLHRTVASRKFRTILRIKRNLHV